ncbi:MAG TPA: PaaX family transcriptional regulator C-terminal domain-containing protein [Solirubrobacteraceae bacterium]|nr:PaaX family transcriptional regulator C-terminal domain-containing protein [Solirubrobacteraceae bacterium]
MAGTAHRTSGRRAGGEYVGRGNGGRTPERLPRTQLGTTPQHLLMTLLGDYWFERSEHLPSAALVDLLAEFAISEPSARAALNRLAKRGLLVSSKAGRNTYYGVSPRAVPLLRETLKRLVAFGARETRSWDGAWTIVAFSVPEVHRDVRHSIRTTLRWLGFAALYDGLWCSPWLEQDAALAMLSDLGVRSATVMRARIDPRSAVQAGSAWDLEALKQQYLEFDEEFSPMLDDVRRGTLTASEALIARTTVMDSWRRFLGVEPFLPADLLPSDWPRASMRELFLELYDNLAPVAKARCQQIVAKHSPELATLVTHHAVVEPAV